MPLNIDIAFRWLQKKNAEEEEKKKQESLISKSEVTTTSESSDDSDEDSSDSKSSSIDVIDTDDDIFDETRNIPAEKKDKLKPKDMEVVIDEDKDPNHGIPVRRRVIFIRHAERIDTVFPAWHRLANSQEEYKRYDTNQPLNIMDRRCGVFAFQNDPVITSMGRMQAQLVGQSLKRHGDQISAIYCSPSLRCLQTAAVIYSELLRKIAKNEVLPKIQVEPAFFDYLGWYFDGLPLWLSTKEMVESGYPIDPKYKQIITREQMLRSRSENKNEYYRRSAEVMRRILSKNKGSVLVVGHATTMDSAVRGLLRLPKSIPTSRQMDTLCMKYPYCSSCIVEQYQDITGKGQWRLGDNLLPITALGQSSRLDFKFLLRK